VARREEGGSYLGGRVVVVVVRLVVLVPLVPGVHPVVVLGLAGAVLLVPPVHFGLHLHLPAKGGVPLLVDVPHGVGSCRLEAHRVHIASLQIARTMITPYFGGKLRWWTDEHRFRNAAMQLGSWCLLLPALLARLSFAPPYELLYSPHQCKTPLQTCLHLP